MDKVTKKPGNSKPSKPHKDFPLFPHATKRWAKKIRGKLHYFGRWDNPDAALQLYLDQKDDLLAGRTPRIPGHGFAVRDLLNRFLTAKRLLVDTSELAPRTFTDYHATCERIVDAFGKTRLVSDLAADDFERLRARLSKGRGPIALGNEIQRVRVVFKYAYDAGLIDRPVRFGPSFKRPSRKVLRLERAKKGPRMFEAADLKKIIGAATNPLRAMILLGVNCGFGNTDVANLPIKTLDLELGGVDYPRPKTGIPRRCHLWPETVDALSEAINKRPKPKDSLHEGLVFITRCGQPWQKADRVKALIAKFDNQQKESDEKKKIGTDDPVCKEFSKLIKFLKLHRPGLGFYALRHTFETIGGESRDQVAVNHVMGHAPAANDMASVYRERISDERLKAVTDYVHKWLFGPKPNETSPSADRQPVGNPVT